MDSSPPGSSINGIFHARVLEWGVIAFSVAAAAAAKSLQSCLTLCDSIDSSPQGSPVPGILQARTLECIAISFSNAWKWKVKAKSLSRVRLLATPWTTGYQVPPSMGLSRQKYWSGLLLPSPLATPNSHSPAPNSLSPSSPPIKSSPASTLQQFTSLPGKLLSAPGDTEPRHSVDHYHERG